MVQSYIFSKENKHENLFYLSIIPLIIYGVYKNCFLIVHNHFDKSSIYFNVLLYPLSSILIGLILGLIFKKRRKELINYGIIAGLTAPFSISFIYYLLIVFIVSLIVIFVPNKYRINENALVASIFILLNISSNHLVVSNAMELSNKYKFSQLDIFFGRGPSFIFTSSIFLLLASYIILSFVKTYKKSIFVTTITTYVLLLIGYMFYKNDFKSVFDSFLNGTTFFSFIYLASHNESSPSVQKEIYIYGILIGVITFVLCNLFDILAGSVLAVLITSVIYRIYNIFRQKMFLRRS